MDDSGSDSEVEFPVSRKRKANVIHDEEDEDDESDEDNEGKLRHDSGSDSEVEFPVSRKRKANVIDDEEDDDDDESDDDDEDSGDEEDEEEEESDDGESGENDDDLADDVCADQCPICLMEFTDQLIGIPDSCTHVFCNVCILEWSKNVNTCPVDRKVYYTIAIQKIKDGQVIEQVKVEDRTAQLQVQDQHEDQTTCEICGAGDREDRMLLCDECDRGFHMECLTPPLETIPMDEWFCTDCLPDQSVNAEDCQFIDDTSSIDISQEAETSATIDQPTTRSRRSTRGRSTRGRARTVATTRRRRTTRQPSRRRSSAKSSSTRGESSSRGASTSTKPKKRQVKKRRRKRKRKRKAQGGKAKQDGKGGRFRPRNDVSPSRYLLPHEMEPSATFSLFGSDFDLEYLPIVEARTVAKEPKTKKLSSTSNRDVLGTIFTDLNTLYKKDLTVDTTGRLSASEDATNTKSHSSVACSSKAGQQRETKNTGSTDTSNNSREMSELNRKRIKYFEKAAMNSKEVSTFNTVFAAGKFGKETSTLTKSRLRDHNPQGTMLDNVEQKRVLNGNSQGIMLHSVEQKRVPKGNSQGIMLDSVEQKRSPQDNSPRTMLDSVEPKRISKGKHSVSKRKSRKSGKTNSLSSYKIPRKTSNITDASLSSIDSDTPGSKANATSLSAGRVSKSKPSTSPQQKTTFKGVGYSTADGILQHLLPEKSRPKERSILETNLPADTVRHQDKKNPLNTTTNFCPQLDTVSPSRFSGSPSCTATSNQSSTLQGPFNAGNESAVTSEKCPRKPVSHVVSEHFSTSSPSGSGQHQKSQSGITRFATDTCAVPHGNNTCTLKNRNITLPKCPGDDNIRGKRVSYDQRYFTKLNSASSNGSIASTSGSSGVQTAANLQLIGILKKKRTHLSGLSDDDSRGTTGQTGNSSSAPRCIRKLQDAQETLPALRPTSLRPVAVVHPTKLKGGESLSAVDAAKRRKEGIERVRRNQTIQDEVKTYLKSYYYSKQITKEEYKLIYKRAVNKIKDSSADVQSHAVSNLVRNYVKKMRGESWKSTAVQ